MKILFVTTGWSHVLATLGTLPQVELHTLDCGSFPYSRKEFRSQLGTVFGASPIELLITYRCPYIVPTDFLSKAVQGLNIHPSLLPEGKGLNPWEEILSRRRNSCGVTIHQLTEHVDEGEVLLREPCPLSFADTLETAREKTDRLAARMIQRLLPTL